MDKLKLATDPYFSTKNFEHTLRLKNALNINLQGGMAVRRRLELIDINDETIDRTPKAAPFFAVGLSLAPKIKNPEVGLDN